MTVWNAPDGTPYEFGDMPEEQVKAVMRRKFGGGPPAAAEAQGEQVAPTPPAPAAEAPPDHPRGMEFLRQQGQEAAQFGQKALNEFGLGLPNKALARAQALISSAREQGPASTPEDINKRYEENKAAIRRREAEFAAQHPYASMAATGAGVGASLLLPEVRGAVGLARAAPAVGREALSLGQRGLSLLGRGAEHVAPGAVGGAVSGYNVKDDMNDAYIGGLIGGAGGPLTGLAARGVGNVARAVVPQSVRTGASNMMARLAGQAPEARTAALADRRLAETVGRSTENPQQMEDMLRSREALGAQPVLADVNPPMQSLARAAHAVPSRGGTDIAQAVNERQVGSTTRLASAIEDHVAGSSHDADTLLTRLKDRREATAGPAFRAADISGPAWDEEIADLIKLPSVKSGLAEGVDIEMNRAAGEGRQANLHDYALSFDAQGNPIVDAVPTVGLLHAAATGIDARIAKARQTGTYTNAEAALASLSARLRKKIKEYSPEFRSASDQFRQMSGPINAIEKGKDIKKMSAEQVRKAYEEIQPHNRQFFRMGVADSMKKDVFTGKAEFPDKAGTILNNELGTKLQHILPQDAQHRLEQTARAEREATKTYRALGGSPTARIQESVRGEGASESGDITDALLGAAAGVHSGGFSLIPAIRGAAKAVHQRSRYGMTEELANQLAPSLLSRDPTVVSQVMGRLTAAQQREAERILRERLRYSLLTGHAGQVPSELTMSDEQRQSLLKGP
jgi:hypothetical protein